MYEKRSEHEQAQYLYLHTNLTQQEIAGQLGIDRKTLFNWIREGNWKRAKYIVKYAPSILMEQYYTQLGAINNEIASREDRPYPTREEAETIRKLSITIRHMKGDRQPIADNIELFTDFIMEVRLKDKKIAEQIVPHLDDYVQNRVREGRGLDSAWSSWLKDRKEEKEYEQWQIDENRLEETRGRDRQRWDKDGTGIRPVKVVLQETVIPRPLSVEDILAASYRESGGESEPSQDPAEPAVVNTSSGIDNVQIPQSENEPEEGISVEEWHQNLYAQFKGWKGNGAHYYTDLLEDRFHISLDKHVTRRVISDNVGITIIRHPSLLWGYNKCLFFDDAA